ncbi:MAG: FAD-dependent oxidoreductase [Bacillota bacterium]|uniref:FAD-dependent oxidoreductase n=1 Tax=Thermanaerosceptrum fracticalcis TaxID=1712410 RepID=UPI0005502E95|nr:FAD-dependent oxidoreductase [Thermanaerosceptrum fracticalcis]
MGKRLVVIGGVAAGTKAASKAKRENMDLEVIVLTRDKDISYAGCGLPYYIGGLIKERKELVVRGPEEFEIEQGIHVLTRREVTRIIPDKKSLLFTELDTGAIHEIGYDYLIIATGASPVLPRLPGIDLQNIFTLRTVQNAEDIRCLVEEGQVGKAVVVGAGFIGLETAENLVLRGLEVTVVEMAPAILPGYDEEMAKYVENYLVEKGINIKTAVKVCGFRGDPEGRVKEVLLENESLEADLVIWAGGVRPNVQLAKDAGISLGPTGCIAVNEYQETNLPDIYAVGDCAENYNLLTQEPVWYPMGSTANKTGRIAGLNLGREDKADFLPGVLGTSIIKLFELQAARTGLTEEQARNQGYDVETVIVPANDKAHYYPGYRQIITKLIADKKTKRILGAQVVGEGVVDKPIDIIVAMISCQATVEQLARLDLAYAPPFSMAMSSTIMAANVMMNKFTGKFASLNPRELVKAMVNHEVLVLDVRTEAEYFIKAIPGSLNIPFNQLIARYSELPQDKKIVVVCKVGKRAYLTLSTLRKLGFNDLAILDGGIESYPYTLE